VGKHECGFKKTTVFLKKKEKQGENRQKGQEKELNRKKLAIRGT